MWMAQSLSVVSDLTRSHCADRLAVSADTAATTVQRKIARFILDDLRIAIMTRVRH